MIAPSAPSTRSSHMNTKRSWPGVPNRYRISDESSVMRPKSSATVVVCLSLRLPGLSTPTDFSVMAASVTSGSISEMAPTNVVLPTPKPPLTTILTARGGSSDLLERPNTVPDPLDHIDGYHGRRLDRRVSLRDEVADQHPGHAQRHT